MRSLCLVLLVALSTPGCSMFSKNARNQRAYQKYINQSLNAREKRHKQILAHQRAEMPKLRNMPPSQEQQSVQQMPTESAPENH
jgi:uncharacterized protein YceK